MLIGDSVTYDGRPHVVVGFTPTSVKPAEVQLRDPETGETIWVDLQQTLRNSAPHRSALRALPRKPGRR
jgi:hypothetical protein